MKQVDQFRLSLQVTNRAARHICPRNAFRGDIWYINEKHAAECKRDLAPMTGPQGHSVAYRHCQRIKHAHHSSEGVIVTVCVGETANESVHTKDTELPPCGVLPEIDKVPNAKVDANRDGVVK